MTLQPLETLIAARAQVYLAPTGTAAPVDALVAIDPAWHFVGNTTEDSLSFSTEPEFEEVRSHQSDYPIRRFQTSDSATLSVDLLQWNSQNMIYAFGGGTVTAIAATTPTQYKFVPPRLGARAEVSALIEVLDGERVFRYVYPRAQQIEGVEAQLQKGSASTLPLRLSVLGGDSTDPWYLLVSDPTGGFGPVGP